MIPKYAELEWYWSEFLANKPLHSADRILAASEYFRKAIARKKNHFEAHYLMGLSFASIDPELSLKTLQKACLFQPNSAMMRYQIAAVAAIQLETSKPEVFHGLFLKVMDELEAGNALSLTETIELTKPAPPLLTKPLYFLGLRGITASMLLLCMITVNTAREMPWCSEDSPEYFRLCRGFVGFAANGCQYLFTNQMDMHRPFSYYSIGMVKIYPMVYYSEYNEILKSYTKFPNEEKRLYLEKYHDMAMQMKEYDKKTLN